MRTERSRRVVVSISVGGIATVCVAAFALAGRVEEEWLLYRFRVATGVEWYERAWALGELGTGRAIEALFDEFLRGDPEPAGMSDERFLLGLSVEGRWAEFSRRLSREAEHSQERREACRAVLVSNSHRAPEVWGRRVARGSSRERLWAARFLVGASWGLVPDVYELDVLRPVDVEAEALDGYWSRVAPAILAREVRDGSPPRGPARELAHALCDQLDDADRGLASEICKRILELPQLPISILTEEALVEDRLSNSLRLQLLYRARCFFPEAVEAVAAGARSRFDDVRQHAARALSGFLKADPLDDTVLDDQVMDWILEWRRRWVRSRRRAGAVVVSLIRDPSREIATFCSTLVSAGILDAESVRSLAELALSSGEPLLRRQYACRVLPGTDIDSADVAVQTLLAVIESIPAEPSDEEDALRSEAAKSLRLLGPIAVRGLPDLFDRIPRDGAISYVHDVCVQTIRSCGTEAFPFLIARSESSDLPECRLASYLLALKTKPFSRDMDSLSTELVERLFAAANRLRGEPDASVKRNAVAMVTHMANLDARAMRLTLEWLESDDVELRHLAARGLCHAKGDHTERFVRLLQDDEVKVIFWAVRGLADSLERPAFVVPALISRLSKGIPGKAEVYFLSSLQQAWSSGPDASQWLPLVRAFYEKSPHMGTRRAAFVLLMKALEANSEERAACVERGLLDSSQEVRSLAIASLPSLDSATTARVDRITRLVASASGEELSAVVFALLASDQVKFDADVAFLERLKTVDAGSRYLLEGALRDLASESDSSRLRVLNAFEDPVIHGSLIECVRYLGERGTVFIPKLEDISRSGEDALRAKAASAIEQIRRYATRQSGGIDDD